MGRNCSFLSLVKYSIPKNVENIKIKTKTKYPPIILSWTKIQTHDSCRIPWNFLHQPNQKLPASTKPETSCINQTRNFLHQPNQKLPASTKPETSCINQTRNFLHQPNQKLPASTKPETSCINQTRNFLHQPNQKLPASTKPETSCINQTRNDGTKQTVHKKCF